MAYIIAMEFEWDDAKNNALFVRRGFDIAYAVRVCFDPHGSLCRIADRTMARIATGCSA